MVMTGAADGILIPLVVAEKGVGSIVVVAVLVVMVSGNSEGAGRDHDVVVGDMAGGTGGTTAAVFVEEENSVDAVAVCVMAAKELGAGISDEVTVVRGGGGCMLEDEVISLAVVTVRVTSVVPNAEGAGISALVAMVTGGGMAEKDVGERWSLEGGGNSLGGGNSMEPAAGSSMGDAMEDRAGARPVVVVLMSRLVGDAPIIIIVGEAAAPPPPTPECCEVAPTLFMECETKDRPSVSSKVRGSGRSLMLLLLFIETCGCCLVSGGNAIFMSDEKGCLGLLGCCC